MTKPLQFCEKWRKMNGPEKRGKRFPGPEQRQPVEEVATMPNCADYSDSAPSGKTEQPANTWKPIGDLARALVERAAKK
jgi:hypothetical protein